MAETSTSLAVQLIEQLGRSVVEAVREAGYLFALLAESLFWIFCGAFYRQPVRINSIFTQMMQVGISAIPIVFVLSFAIGVMLAIQGIQTLKTFGAESTVVYGIAFSVVREFGPLITGILIAGRSGSALAARIGTMQVNQEIDALQVMGINPARYLVAPAVLAMLIMMPTLAFFSDVVGMLGGAVYSNLELGQSYNAYAHQSLEYLKMDDVMQGLIKSVVFALIVVMVGVVNGFSVRGGAEGVGRATTRSVVMAISLIVIADMLFTYFLNR